MDDKSYKNTCMLSVDIGDMTVTVFITGKVKEKNLAAYSDSHFHTLYEFQYILKESITIVDEKCEHTVNEGEYILIPPGIFHAKKKDDNAVRYTLLFSVIPNKVSGKNFSEYCYYSNILSSIKYIGIYNNRELCPIMDKIIKLESYDFTENSHILKIYISVLITEFLRFANNTSSFKSIRTEFKNSSHNTTEDEYLKFIIEGCIQSHFTSKNISQLICEKLNMSNRNCIRVIHRLFGESLTELVTKQRMKLARTLIMKTERTLNDIAQAVGYNTYVSFFTAFKKYYGISPVILRQNKTD